MTSTPTGSRCRIQPERGASVRNLIVWCPGGLRTEEIQALLSLRKLSGQRGDYEDQRVPGIAAAVPGGGRDRACRAELCGPSRRWRSRTPYLPVRHRKRETPDEYVAADVAAELRYRDKPPGQVSRLDPGSAMTDRWASEFTRRRIREPLARESTQRVQSVEGWAPAGVHRAGRGTPAARAAQPLRVRHLCPRPVMTGAPCARGLAVRVIATAATSPSVCA